MKLEEEIKLFHKWKSKGGRYTSYPHQRFWSKETHIPFFINEDAHEVDLYVHIPFCESLCNFCGLNIKVTKDRENVEHFIRALILDLKSQLDFLFEKKPKFLGNLYIGGGTPNYFTPNELSTLFSELFKLLPQGKHFHGCFEAHPKKFTEDYSKVLKEFGFNRVLFGVQDLSLQVLHEANRHQTLHDIISALQSCWGQGIETHLDFIYGLPLQTPESFSHSVKTITEFVKNEANTLALYPLMGPLSKESSGENQNNEQKILSYLKARDIILNENYLSMGHGQFFGPTSSLTKAFKEKKLRRNLSAFFNNKSNILIPLGPGAQGYSSDFLWSNEKITEKYIAKTQSQKERFFIHHLTKKEKDLRILFEQILVTHTIPDKSLSTQKIQELIQDELLALNNQELKITLRGTGHISAIIDCLYNHHPLV